MFSLYIAIYRPLLPLPPTQRLLFGLYIRGQKTELVGLCQNIARMTDTSQRVHQRTSPYFKQSKKASSTAQSLIMYQSLHYSFIESGLVVQYLLKTKFSCLACGQDFHRDQPVIP